LNNTGQTAEYYNEKVYQACIADSSNLNWTKPSWITLTLKKYGHNSSLVSSSFSMHQSQHFEHLKGSVKEQNILIYFFFLSFFTQWCSISDVLFTGGKEVSDLMF